MPVTPNSLRRRRGFLPARTRSGLAGVIQSKPRLPQAARICLASNAVSPSTRTRLPLGTRRRRIICAAMSAWVAKTGAGRLGLALWANSLQ